MNKFLAISLMGLFCCTSLLAQQTTSITGTLKDAETNMPLSGARIQYGSNSLTTSDTNGNFFIPCNSKAETLTISYIGYESQHFESLCDQNLQVKLNPIPANLDAVELSGKKAQEQKLSNPQALIHLTAKELNRGNGLFLDDAINANVPGVTMQRRAVSSGQQFNIRGYGNGVGFRGATNNFDGQGYKVYLNGIPLTDAEGITQLDDIDFASIGNVDVLKGPAGTRYGFSIAGAVNLTSIQPAAETTSINQKITVGKFGLLRLTSQLQLGGKKSSLLLNYGHQVSDGFMSHNNSQKEFVNLIFNYKPSSKQSLNGYFGYSNSYDERGGELSMEQYANKDYTGNARYIKNNAHSEVISFRAGFNHTYQFTHWLSNSSTVFGTGVNSNASSAGGWTDKNPLNYGLRSVFDMRFKLNENVALQGSSGIELQEQRTLITGYSMVENPNEVDGYNIIGGFKSNQFSRSSTSHVFTDWTLKLPRGFSVNAGIGLSAMQIDLEDRLYNPDSNKERRISANYKSLYAPHLAINKIFSDAVSLYASYSKGYKAPVSSNIVISTTGALNTGLVPEVGNQFEIGSKGTILNNRLNYELAVFQTTFSNKFTAVSVPLDENTTAYSYISNGGKQNHKGIETLVNYTAYEATTGVFSLIAPYANFTYSDFEYKNYQYQRLDAEGNTVILDYSGKAVAGVSPWVVNTGIDFNLNAGLYGNLNYQYRDAMPFTSDGLNRTNSFNLMNAKLGYRTHFDHFDLDVFAGADNLTGTQYYYMVFVNQLPDAYIPAPYEVNYYAGASLKYIF